MLQLVNVVVFADDKVRIVLHFHSKRAIFERPPHYFLGGREVLLHELLCEGDWPNILHLNVALVKRATKINVNPIPVVNGGDFSVLPNGILLVSLGIVVEVQLNPITNH